MNVKAEGGIWRPKFTQLNFIHSIKADEAVASVRRTEAAWENSKSVETCNEGRFIDLLHTFALTEGRIVMNWFIYLLIPSNHFLVIAIYLLSNYLSVITPLICSCTFPPTYPPFSKNSWYFWFVRIQPMWKMALVLFQGVQARMQQTVNCLGRAAWQI